MNLPAISQGRYTCVKLLQRRAIINDVPQLVVKLARSISTMSTTDASIRMGPCQLISKRSKSLNFVHRHTPMPEFRSATQY